jgi:phage shock protein C
MSEYATFDDTFANTGQPGQPAAQPAPAAPARRTFRRSRTDRMLAGLCGGLAETLGVDATLLRVAMVALTVLSSGSGAIIYLVCWLVVPETDPAGPAGTGTAAGTTTAAGHLPADRSE